MHGANVKILHVPPGDLHISPVVGVPSFELLLYTRITWPTIGIIMEPLCVCGSGVSGSIQNGYFFITA